MSEQIGNHEFGKPETELLMELLYQKVSDLFRDAVKIQEIIDEGHLREARLEQVVMQLDKSFEPSESSKASTIKFSPWMGIDIAHIKLSPPQITDIRDDEVFSEEDSTNPPFDMHIFKIATGDEMLGYGELEEDEDLIIIDDEPASNQSYFIHLEYHDGSPNDSFWLSPDDITEFTHTLDNNYAKTENHYKLLFAEALTSKEVRSVGAIEKADLIKKLLGDIRKMNIVPFKSLDQ